MKIDGNLLVFNTMDRIYIEWEKLPFDLNITVLWWGIYFAFQIKAFNIEKGSTKSYSVYYKSQRYTYKWTNYKWMMGHHGDNFPEIITSNHKLKFQPGQNTLEIIDMPNESSDQNHPGDNSFVLFYQS